MTQTTTAGLPTIDELPMSRDEVRARFPTLGTSSDILLDNAGGSQVPGVVSDGLRDYMRAHYVQLGADYETSKRSTNVVSRAHELIATVMNAPSVGKVVLGPSSTALCHILAESYARSPKQGRDEVIIAETGHEANVGPWTRLADRGWKTTFWRLDRDAGNCTLDGLRALLSERTRLVAFPLVSNILGGVESLEAITKLAHDAGARVVVDAVAFAPHRAMDVRAWGVDWCFYSTYKVYGPHMAALFGRDEAFVEIEGPNHFFIPKGEVPCKFELGGCSHEGCAGVLALWSYLCELAGSPADEEFSREVAERAFAAMTALELPLQERFMAWLSSRSDLTIYGPVDGGLSRVPTFSFTKPGRSSREIVERVNAKGVGIRYGHFYAHRLCAALGLVPEDGVIRASAVHYNTEAEIDRLIETLEETLD